MAVAAMATNDRPIVWGLLQLQPLGGAFGHGVCLTVVGDGIVGLGVV